MSAVQQCECQEEDLHNRIKHVGVYNLLIKIVLIHLRIDKEGPVRAF